MKSNTDLPKAPESKPAHAGHDHHAHMAADFQKMLQTMVGLREAIRFPGDIYVLFGLSSALFWYGGWPFLKGLFTPRLRRGGDHH